MPPKSNARPNAGPPDNPGKPAFRKIYLLHSRVPVSVPERVADRLIQQGKASADPPAQQRRPSVRVVQLFETGQIMKVPDAEAARLVEAEEAGYVI